MKSREMRGEETRKTASQPARASSREEGESKVAWRTWTPWEASEAHFSEAGPEEVVQTMEEAGRRECVSRASRVAEPSLPLAPMMASMFDSDWSVGKKQLDF